MSDRIESIEERVDKTTGVPIDEMAAMIRMWVVFHDARPDISVEVFLRSYMDQNHLNEFAPDIHSLRTERDALRRVVKVAFPKWFLDDIESAYPSGMTRSFFIDDLTPTDWSLLRQLVEGE